MAFIKLGFSVTTMRFQYYCALPVSMHMDVFIRNGWRVASSMELSITAQYSPGGLTVDYAALLTDIWVFGMMVATLLAIRL